MIAEGKDFQLAYRRLMLAVGVVLIGGGVAYGFANYKFDQCSSDLLVRMDALKVKVDDAKKEMERK
jgi:hypothetical protein